MREDERKQLLLVRAGAHRAGIPLENVREIMRPLPIQRLSGTPHFVLGLAKVRGASVPVVDLGTLLESGAQARTFGRFVALEVDGRAVALAVDAVDGVSEVNAADYAALPPLFERAASDVVQALGLRDAELLLVLDAARLVPEDRVLAGGTPE